MDSCLSLSACLEGLAQVRKIATRFASISDAASDSVAAVGPASLARARSAHDLVCRIVDGLQEVAQGRTDYVAVVSQTKAASSAAATVLAESLGAASTSRAQLAELLERVDSITPFLLGRE